MGDVYIPNVYYWEGVYVLLGWVALLWLASRVMGWAELAKTYRATETQLDDVHWHGWQGGRFQMGLGLNRCLWIGLSPAGLALKTGPDIIFRPGFAPLFIPWQKIQVTGSRKLLWRSMVCLQVQDVPFPILLPEKTLQQAGDWLPAVNDGVTAAA